MKTWKFCLIAGVLILAVSACGPMAGEPSGSGDGQTPGAETSLANTRWMLLSYGVPGSETPVIEGTRVNLEFQDGGQAGGSGGCNSYSAQYKLQENMLSFSDITRTLMACEQEGIGQQEERYLQALETTGKFELAQDRLTIWYDNGQSVLNFVKETQ